MQNAIAVGGRISLRPLTGADAAAFVPWVNDPEVTRTLAIGARVMDVRAEEVFIEKTNASAHAVLFGIVVRETGRLIGSTGLDQLEHDDRREKGLGQRLRNGGDRARCAACFSRTPPEAFSFSIMIGEKSAGVGNGRK